MSSEIILNFYPHECIRCGYCCTVEPCSIGFHLGSPRERRCKFLEIGQEKSSCMIMIWKPELMKGMGGGVGCSILARCMDQKTGVIYDFAGLPKKLKREIAVANYHTQGSVGRNKWGCPFEPEQPHCNEENNEIHGKALTR